MGRGLRAGRLFGIEIRLHPSLLVIFAVILVSLGFAVLPAWHPGWSLALTWTVAVGTAVMFFVSVLLHELGHALVGRTQGIETRDITLFLFGGMANAEREPPSPRAELLIAGAGPLVSLLLGLGFSFAAAALADADVALRVDDPQRFVTSLGPAATLCAWLGPINILLAVFNMLPGYPLDGGRVLRALLWGATGDIVLATRWSSRVGRALGYGFVLAGVLMALGVYVPLLGRGFIAGLWMALIGLFLARIAAGSVEQLRIQQTLEAVPVGQVMHPDPVTVGPDTTVATLVERYYLSAAQESFPVIDAERRLLGVVTADDVRRLPRDAWSRTPLRSVMTPLDELRVETPQTQAYTAMRDLAASNISELPVVEDGRLRGLVQRDRLLQWLELASGPGRPS